MDMSLIGETTAKLMDELPDEHEGEVIAVGLVVVIDVGGEDGSTYTRIKTTRDVYFEQIGLFHAALDVARYGVDPEDGEGRLGD